MSLKITVIILLFFPFFAFGQVDFSFIVGGNLSNFTVKDAELLNENEVYLISNENFRELGTTVGFKIHKDINRQFRVDYQMRLFNQLMDVRCVPGQTNTWGLHECYEGGRTAYLHWLGVKKYDKADVFGATHSISFNFRLNENFRAGIGGFYQKVKYDDVRIGYFSIHRIFDYFDKNRSLKQAGCLGTVSYSYKKWTVEVRFLKGVGNTFQYTERPRFFKSIDAFELVLSYKFLKLKKKKKSNK